MRFIVTSWWKRNQTAGVDTETHEVYVSQTEREPAPSVAAGAVRGVAYGLPSG